MTILDKLEAAAKVRVERAKKQVSCEQIKKAALQADCSNRFLFEKRLKSKGLSFICEVKRASPSKGLIAAEFPYLDIAREYQQIGAAAVSVLTEPEYFKGADRYLKEIAGEIQIPELYCWIPKPVSLKNVILSSLLSTTFQAIGECVISV